MPSNINKASKHDKLFTIQDLIEWTPPKVSRIIHQGILNIGNKMLIFGDEGGWKSMLTTHLSLCLANGSPIFGFGTSRCNILRIQVENPMYMERERYKKYCTAHEKIYLSKHMKQDMTEEEQIELKRLANAYAYPTNIVTRTEQFIHFDESYGNEALKRSLALCKEHLPDLPLVIILDPIYLLVGGDTSSEKDMRKLLDNLNILTAEGSCSVILVHHSRKAQVDSEGKSISMGSQDASGTRAFARWADTMWRTDLDPHNDCRTHMTFTKARNAETKLPNLEVKWHRPTLHPQVMHKYIKTDPKEKDEREIRGEFDYTLLEG